MLFRVLELACNMPPQVAEWIFKIPNLERREENGAKPSGFVKMLASWCAKATCRVFRISS
jgi:hypothetical protein